jgi:spoIIIJ-associated protein
MSQEKTTLEIIAPSIEEAVAKGLSQLGLPREAVDVEVLDSGSRGLFGLGSRQARVRLSIHNADGKPAVRLPELEVEEAEELEETVEEDGERMLIVTSRVEEAFSGENAGEPAEEEVVVEGDENALQVAEHVVEELLERMRVHATVKTRYIQPQDSHEQPVILVDIQGNDLSILIGRRTETLNALQYISSLIIGKELGRWTPLMIDVQGYRVRRERSLRQLARRMAEQAIHTGRRQVLEPMPAAERRVIHLELRDHAQVATESTGEEPNRKVTIFLKKS